MKLHAIPHLQSSERVNADRIHVLSHELRTPLAVISGYAQVLREEISLSKMDLVSPILDSVARLDHVISTLLEWEGSSSEHSADSSNCDVGQIAHNVIAKFRALAESKGLYLTVDTNERKVAAYSCGAIIESALTPLIHNAIKFSEAGEIKVTIECSATQVSIHVQDEGPGVPEHDMDLFQPFTQGSSGLDRKHDGLGLGLALAQNHMARISGTVGLINGKPSGAIAHLTFPRFAKENGKLNPRKLAA